MIILSFAGREGRGTGTHQIRQCTILFLIKYISYCCKNIIFHIFKKIFNSKNNTWKTAGGKGANKDKFTDGIYLPLLFFLFAPGKVRTCEDQKVTGQISSEKSEFPHPNPLCPSKNLASGQLQYCGCCSECVLKLQDCPHSQLQSQIIKSKPFYSPVGPCVLHLWPHLTTRKWQVTPVFLPGKSHEQEEPVGLPWGCKESDRTQWLHHYTTTIHWTLVALKRKHGCRFSIIKAAQSRHHGLQRYFQNMGNKHNIPGVKSFPRRLLCQSVLLVSKAHLSPLTFHQVLPPRMGQEVGRNTEMKKTGVMVGSVHKPPPALWEETNGTTPGQTTRQEPAWQPQTEQWEERGWRRPPPPGRRPEQRLTGKAAPEH